MTLSSPQQGRVFEVNAKGEVVFEFVNRYDDQHSMLVSELVTLPTGHFKPSVFVPCVEQFSHKAPQKNKDSSQK